MAPTPIDRPIRLLLVDDDADDYLLTQEIVAEIPGGGYTLDWERDYEAGVAAVCKGEHDVFLIDYRIGEKTGLDLWKETRTRTCHGPMILLTGQGGYEIDQAAMAVGAADFLEKDRLDPKVLERSIRYTLRQFETERALERKVAERTAELEAANESLRLADRRKDEFLSTLAHELRNPLAPIRNALEIMRLAESEPDVIARARQLLDRQVRTMIRLVEDLLDVARITRGKLRLNLEPVDLIDAVRDAVETTQPLFDNANVSLTVDVPANPLPVNGDLLRLAQVIANVLGNAAKYSESGGACSLTASRDGGDAVVRIRDSGVGIPADVLPNVFDLFTQVDRTLNRAQGGLGIGLALVRQIVAMHAGSVTARSAGIGTGAEFEIRIPSRQNSRPN